MANLPSGSGGGGSDTTSSDTTSSTEPEPEDDPEPTGDPYQGAQTGSDVYRPGTGGDDDSSDSSSRSSTSTSSPSSSTTTSGTSSTTSSRTSSKRAEEIKRRAAEIAAGAADNINVDEGVDGRTKSSNKEIAQRAQRAAEMAPPTNHTLETMDQSSRVSDMARAGAGQTPDPFSGAQTGSDVYRPGTGGGDETDTSSTTTTEQNEQGVETEDSRTGQQARDFESNILADNPSLDASDVAIQRDGDQLVASYTASGRQQIQNRLERSARGAARAVQADPGYQGNRQAQYVRSITGAARAVEADTGENPLNIRVNSPRQQSGPVNRQTAEAVQRQEFRSRLEREYPDQEFAIERTDDGLRARPVEQGEQFGDFDWSFGLGGPEDEVEQAVKAASQTYSEFAQDVGQATASTSATRTAYNPGVLFLQAAGADVGTVAEEPVDPREFETTDEYTQAVRERNQRVASSTPKTRYAAGTATGALALGNIPALADVGMEASEYGGYGVTEAASGRTGEFVEDSAERAVEIKDTVVQQATENPASTAGLLSGALVGSAGAIRAASAVGPRAGTAARFAIQPGEEVAGRLGYSAVRATRGTKAADRFFPNREPLIFSEEAALRAGSKAADRLGDISPSRRVRSAASDVRERTPTARLVRDPDSGPVSVDSELVAEIGDTARRYRQAFAERASPSAARQRISDLRPDVERPQATPRIGSGRQGIAPLVQGAQRPSLEGSVASGASRVANEARDLLGTAGYAGRDGVAPLVRGAQRPSLEGQFANRAGRTAQEAQNLIDSVRGFDRGSLSMGDGRQGAAPLVQGAQRPSIEGGLAEAGTRARQAVRDADFPSFGVRASGGRDGLAPLVAGAQGPSLEGQASRAFNFLAFEGRRRGLQAREAASDLPSRIADARRAYTFAFQSDLAEAQSGLDTRFRQARSLVSDTELPSRPTADDVRGRLSGLGDYTLRLEPSARYWDTGGSGSRVPNRIDVGDFDGLDVDGVLGDVDTRNVETETNTDSDTDPDLVDRDAGDGMVAVESRAEMAEPVDTARTGTGTDSARRAPGLPVSRAVATAAQPETYDFESAVPAGSELVDTRPETRGRSVQAGRSDLDIGQEFSQEFGIENILGTETEVETDQSPRRETETRSLLDVRRETAVETETEIESEPEFEPEGRGDSDPFRPDDNDFGFIEPAHASDDDTGLSAGWYNEFVTAFALGAGPREVARGQDSGAVRLSEQRQTAAQARGGEDIANAEAAFSFEGLGIGLADSERGSGGDDSWDFF